jgi:hypothetical protein
MKMWRWWKLPPQYKKLDIIRKVKRLITMIRYIFAVIIVLIFMIVPIWMTGDLNSFWDELTTLICVVFPIVFMLVLYGFKNSLNAFAIAFRKQCDKKDLNMALIFFKTLEKLIWLASGLGFIIGMVQMLLYTDDLSNINLGLAIDSLCIFSGFLMVIIVIVPLKFKIEQKLNQEL